GIRFHFVHGPDGEGSISSNYAVNYPPPGDDYMAIDRSWEIEFTDIDWNAYPVPLFDLWVNGFLIGECLPFVFPVESFERLDLFNQSTGAVHFDDILMAKADLVHRCPQVGEPPPAPDWQPLPPPQVTPTFTTTPTPAPLTFTVTVNAFCRFGPGMDYPVVTAYTPGHQLIVNGQNMDGSWFWSEAAHCWISGKLGELSEPPQPLPMLTPPPTSTWTPEPTEEPETPQGCYEEMEKEPCEESGGTWKTEVGMAPYCDCP
ncbi:MAG: hypothetical protein GTO14_11300, partial [Anaerolineales bacterium]|nr:hypothetical protein [Anaerolineales bacterium]